METLSRFMTPNNSGEGFPVLVAHENQLHQGTGKNPNESIHKVDSTA
jgi:hypothetical protein